MGGLVSVIGPVDTIIDMAEAFRIFIASPSDVGPERDAASGVINEISTTLQVVVPEAGIRLKFVRWEDMYPAFHPEGGQGAIFEQMGEIDIFVGIMAARFGNPTRRAKSGTEEEFREAYRRYREHGAPHILFYFSEKLIKIPSNTEAVEELSKVVTFRSEVQKKGLVAVYDSVETFRDRFRGHLLEVLKKLRTEQPAAPLPAVVATATARAVPRGSSGTQRDLPVLGRDDDIAFAVDAYDGDGVSSDALDAVPSGARIRVVEVSERDAFYGTSLEGAEAIVLNLERRDDRWWWGRIRLAGDGREITTYELAFDLVSDPPHAE